MKGQIATEYIMLVGVFLVFIITVFYFTSTEYVKTIQISKADNVVNTLAKTADYIYTLGPGSQDLVEVDMPGGIENIQISKNEILLKLRVYGGIADIYAKTNANVTGNISTTNGIKHIKLKVLSNGVVEIEE